VFIFSAFIIYLEWVKVNKNGHTVKNHGLMDKFLWSLVSKVDRRVTNDFQSLIKTHYKNNKSGDRL